MKVTEKNKIEYWQDHVLRASSYPEGIRGYCVDQKIAKSAVYRWKKYFEDAVLPVKNKKLKKPSSIFLPVAISDADSRPAQLTLRANKLPDPRWVAEIIFELHKRCSL